MYNQRVEYRNSQWTYSPSKYWPLNQDEKITFRAYAPYVSYALQTDANGLPLLPVVVKNSDFHNGTQHDPLWGTSKHDGLLDSDDAAENNEVYGKLYDNYTYAMSGDNLVSDARDGIIDWYFHHGMAKLGFTISLTPDPGCENVTITKIEITPLYTQGLLALSSQSKTEEDKPTWTSRGGTMDVTLNGASTEDEGVTWAAGDLAPIPDPEHPENAHPEHPYPFTIKPNEDPTKPSDPVLLISKGLLIIPRDYSSDAMTITVTYYIDGERGDLLEAEATIERDFPGNTSYNLGLKLTPSTKGLKIDVVLSAFTKWVNGPEVDYAAYNW